MFYVMNYKLCMKRTYKYSGESQIVIIRVIFMLFFLFMPKLFLQSVGEHRHKETVPTLYKKQVV